MLSFLKRRDVNYVSPEEDVWQGGYKWFNEHEMACRCDNESCDKTVLPRHSHMLKLDWIRGALAVPLIVTSGYRCPVHNKRPSGPHVKGLATDILIHGEDAIKLIVCAYSYGMTGIGVSQKGDFSKRFIHLDSVGYWEDKPDIRIWSY